MKIFFSVLFEELHGAIGFFFLTVSLMLLVAYRYVFDLIPFFALIIAGLFGLKMLFLGLFESFFLSFQSPRQR